MGNVSNFAHVLTTQLYRLQNGASRRVSTLLAMAIAGHGVWINHCDLSVGARDRHKLKLAQR